MADNVRALVIKSGTQQQIPAADSLLVGSGIDASSGSGALVIGGATATSITIGSGSITTDFPGPVQLTGDVTTVGGTTFTSDATFEGNVTFGNGPADTVTFASTTTIINDIAFNGAGYRVTNMLDPTGPSTQEGATAAWVTAQIAAIPPTTPGAPADSIQFNDGAGGFAGSAALTFDSANATLTITGDANPALVVASEIDGAFLQVTPVQRELAIFDPLTPTDSTVVSPTDVAVGNGTQSGNVSAGSVGVTDNGTTNALSLTIPAGVATIKSADGTATAQTLLLDASQIDVNSVKIVNVADGVDPTDAVNKSQLDALVVGVSDVTATAPLLSSGGATPDISIDTAGAANGDVLTFNAGAWAAAAPVLTPPGGAVDNVQLNDGAGGFAGSASLSFAASTLTVQSTVAVTDGSETLSLTKDSASTDAATLDIEAASSVTATITGGASFLLTPNSIDALTYAASVAIDLDPSLPPLKSVSLTGDITFTTSSVAAARNVSVRVIGDTVSRNLVFPAGWTWLGGAAPTVLEANKVAIMSIAAFGATDSTIVASWSYDGSDVVTDVTASAPLASSGGATPDISLTGVIAVGNGGTGTSTAFTQGSVVFAGASGVYAQDNASLFFDDGTNSLGIRTATPNEALTVSGAISVGEGSAPSATAAFGKLWANSAADARPYWTDDTGQSFNLTLDRFNTLTPAASVAIDTSPALPVFNSLALNQNTTFTTSNLGNGRSASVRVIGDASTRTLTWPAGWTWLGSGVPPADLAAGDVGYLSITAYGATDADVVAAWSYENQPAPVTDVTASAPLASSGGATPDISLTGVIAVGNGGTGQSTLTSGAIVIGNGASAVNTLSPGSNGQVLTVVAGAWTSQALPAAVDYSVVSITTAVAQGDAVTVAGAAAIATAAASARVAGMVSATANKVSVLGIIEDCNFEGSLTLAVGEAVYLSASSAGKLTNVAPSASGEVVAELGIIVIVNTAGGGAAAADVLWQPKSIVVL